MSAAGRTPPSGPRIGSLCSGYGELGRTGRSRLAAAFVERLIGLPLGWATDLPLSRAGQLRALGNGVVPHQAEAALPALLTMANLHHGQQQRPAA